MENIWAFLGALGEQLCFNANGEHVLQKEEI